MPRVPARTLVGVSISLMLLALAPAAAGAAFHLMKVREVFPSPADGDFVELQMFSAGQNLVDMHEIEVYDAGGTMVHDFPLDMNVANGENQRTVLIGDSDVVAADFTDQDLDIPAPAGAVCFPDAAPPDCVTWGAFTAQTGFPNAQTAPAAPMAGIPVGMSLTRSIAPGCSTLLESSDDTDNSFNDFAVTSPSPRNNATAATETECAAPPPDQPPPPTPDPPPPDPPPTPLPPLDTIAPETTIGKAPKGTIEKDKAKLAFSSNEAGSRFACRLDKAAYKPCTSPKAYKNLDDGKHKFLVRATDVAGNVDPSPAKAKFEVDTG